MGGANFGLDPHDLLKIIHDKTTGLNQKKIIKLLQNGVTSIDYISNLHRLYDLGFTIAELRILMQASISAANVLTYDVIQLFNAIGFTSDFAINGFTNDNIQPTQVSPFIEIGLSVDQHAYIVGYVKNEISPSVAASFNFIGLMHYLPILDFIKAEISSDEVSSFHDIGPKNVSLIFKYKNAGLTADKVSSFFQIENKFSLCPHEIIKYTETLVFP